MQYEMVQRKVIIAHTGAQVDIVGFEHLHKIGLSWENLLRTSVQLNCANANATSTCVLCVIFARITGRSLLNKTDVEVRSMV